MKSKLTTFNKQIINHSKQNNMKKKDMYVSPQVEVIEMENEGVIAASVAGIPEQPIRSSSSRGYNSASSSDVEDLINDILTVGE